MLRRNLTQTLIHQLPLSLWVMGAAPSPDHARWSFQDALLRAITAGQIPARTGDLGARTWSAIEAVAREHPDASVRLIADAYDTFERETTAVDETHGPLEEAQDVERGRIVRAEPMKRPRPSRQRG